MAWPFRLCTSNRSPGPCSSSRVNPYAAQMGSSSPDDQQRTPVTTQYYGSRQSETGGMGDHGMYQSYQGGSVPVGVYTVQGENIFPERPDQPECQFYMKTGDCKFGAVCKFHHPKERLVPAPNCALNSLGLPLRPVRFFFYVEISQAKFCEDHSIYSGHHAIFSACVVLFPVLLRY